LRRQPLGFAGFGVSAKQRLLNQLKAHWQRHAPAVVQVVQGAEQVDAFDTRPWQWS
jgi:uncharacterized hydantoinase/oxoprolinase family protein